MVYTLAAHAKHIQRCGGAWKTHGAWPCRSAQGMRITDDHPHPALLFLDCPWPGRTRPWAQPSVGDTSERSTVLVLVHAHWTKGSYATVQTTESPPWGTPASGRPPHCRAAHPGAHGAKNPAPCRPLRAALHRTGVGVG